MFDWHTAGTYCEEVYGIALDTKEGYFVCPSCGEMIYEDDWHDHDDWEVCPICGDYFCDDREDSAE